MSPMIRALVLSMLMALAQRPGSPSSRTTRDAAQPATVSSGEDAYITWTVDPKTRGMSYDISLDDGPWDPIAPSDLKEVPLSDAERKTLRMYAVNRGKLTVGQHTARVRECDAKRTNCAPPSLTTVTVVPPVPCAMGPWSPWTAWSEWVRAGSVETRSHHRYRAVTTRPGPGAEPCPANVETAPETRPYVPPPLDPVSVTYVRMDSTTKGAWPGRYGSQGQVFASETPRALPFVTVKPIGTSFWLWAGKTADPRGLQQAGTTAPDDRFATTWYGLEPFELDVRFSDAAVHQVALYAMDWDERDRAQTIEVLDSQGTVLHTVKTGAELKTGVYYVWRVSGHARFRVTRTASVNGVVSALLFGPDSGG